MKFSFSSFPLVAFSKCWGYDDCQQDLLVLSGPSEGKKCFPIADVDFYAGIYVWEPQHLHKVNIMHIAKQSTRDGI